MLKKATDNGYPILIAWNPRNRPWSHASVVFDVTGEPGSYLIHVMDPNLADPSKSVMVLSEEDFYSKWYEKVSEEILVRRPGCIVEREVSKEGRQMIASLDQKVLAAAKAKSLRKGLIAAGFPQFEKRNPKLDHQGKPTQSRSVEGFNVSLGYSGFPVQISWASGDSRSETRFWSKVEDLLAGNGLFVEHKKSIGWFVAPDPARKTASSDKSASEIFVNDLGMAFDDEGHKVNVGTSFPEGTYTPSSWGWKKLTEAMSKNQTTSLNLNRWEEESIFYSRWARLALTMGEDWEYKFLISISQWVDKRKPLSEKQLAVIDRMKKKYKNQLNDIEGAIQEIWAQNRKVASRYASRFKFTVTGIPNPVEKYPASIQEATNWAMAVSKRMPRARMLLETPVTKLMWDTMNWRPLGL
jgi:hypothetical protein